MAKIDDYERGNRIRWAARDLGLTGALVDLPAAEAAEKRRRITAHFVYDPLDWWWDQLKSGRNYWNTSKGWHPLNDIAEMCVDEPVWLAPIDPFGEVFEARMPVFLELLKKSFIDEYALVSRDLAWMLIATTMMSCTGRAHASRTICCGSRSGPAVRAVTVRRRRRSRKRSPDERSDIRDQQSVPIMMFPRISLRSCGPQTPYFTLL